MTLITEGLIGLFVIVSLMSLMWVISVRMRDASIADICWGPGFVVLAWLYCGLRDDAPTRSILLASLVTVWGLRLAVHLARRHRGEDPRYAAMRSPRGTAFWWKSLFIVFWLQAALIWVVALPLLVASRTTAPEGVTTTDLAGLLLFLVGFAFEVVGDHQLQRFRALSTNRGKVLDTGLWRYTRHPNYFGDAALWWGIFLIAASTPGGWLTLASPLLMTLLLLRVSGVALLERTLVHAKPGYSDYIARTSAFVPWFPRRPSPTARIDRSRHGR